MKKFFVTGLVILLPLALTVAVVLFMVRLLTDPFVGVIQAIFHKYSLFEKGWLFLSADQLQLVISKIVILFLLFFFTIALGVIARWFLFNYFIRLWNAIIHRIPFINSIYKTSQEVVNTLFSSGKSFKQVVLAPFPNPSAMTVGFVASDGVGGLSQDENQEYVAVFIPTTPNPTSGFVNIYKKDEVIFLDMKVEEAMKFIISCGSIQPTFKVCTDINKLEEPKA